MQNIFFGKTEFLEALPLWGVTQEEHSNSTEINRLKQ